MASSGPIVMQAAGDTYIDSCCIATVVWEGATTAGDIVVLQKRDGGGIIWKGRTSQTQTYLGANLGPSGVSCPKGFTCAQLSAGTLLIYLRED